jgi:type III secretion protein Q
MDQGVETTPQQDIQAAQQRLQVLASTPEFPLINKTEWTQGNILARRRLPAKLDSGAGSLAVWPLPPYLVKQWTGSWARLEVVISDRLAMVSLPIDILLRIAGERFPDLPFDGLEPRLRAIILEYIFTPAIKALEGLLQAPVRLGEVICPTPLRLPADFTFAVAFNESTPFPMAVNVSPIDKVTISQSINAMEPDRKRPVDLTIPVSLRAGYSSFSLSDMALLDVGAGIILDGTYITYQKVAAVVGEQFVQTCTWQNLRPILDGPLLRRADANTMPFTMGAEVNSGFADDNAPPFGTVKDVPVHVVFELGRVTLSVNEIETLGQGYVFDLGRPLSQEVDIISGGRRIGSGELVRIADSIGVRVIQIAT